VHNPRPLGRERKAERAHLAPANATSERITGRWDKKLDTYTGLIETGARPGGEHDDVEQRLKSAAATLRELGLSFWLVVTLLEHSGRPRRMRTRYLTPDQQVTRLTG